MELVRVKYDTYTDLITVDDKIIGDVTQIGGETFEDEKGVRHTSNITFVATLYKKEYSSTQSWEKDSNNLGEQFYPSFNSRWEAIEKINKEYNDQCLNS